LLKTSMAAWTIDSLLAVFLGIQGTAEKMNFVHYYHS